MGYPFLKGHGTRNDFVLLPDHDGELHGELAPERVRALCDRRSGIGGDGVLRVIRTEAIGSELAGDAEWFMDYRNADGSVSEMCGNGVRVFARYLVDAGLATLDGGLPIATRGGVKIVHAVGDPSTGDLIVDMGAAKLLGTSEVAVGAHSWTARHVDMGNPHAVAFVDQLDDAGKLDDAPIHDEKTYPDGVNVEFVRREGERHIAMRVHERGSGETWSCGTGACAAMVATAEADGLTPGTTGADVTYRVDVPGGRLAVTWTVAGAVLLAGPALVVAEGSTALG